MGFGSVGKFSYLLVFEKADIVKSSLGVVLDLFHAFGFDLYLKNYYFSLYFKLYITENFVSLATLDVTFSYYSRLPDVSNFRYC